MLVVLWGFEACTYFNITIKWIYWTYEIKLIFTLFKYMFQLQLKTILTLHIYVFIILFHFQTSKVIFRFDFLSKYANFNEVTWFSSIFFRAVLLFQYFSVTVFLMLNMLTVHNDVYDMTIIHPYSDSCWKFIKKKN